ncbi:MAG: hypothetical protein JWQ89_1862 [Devosia sp.]|nr:hypothetical protein [Devosia sp.]
MLRLTTAIMAATLTLPAVAGEGGDIALRHLYAGTAAAGITELDAPPDAESRFGKGMLQFANAIEHFGQGLYRHGFAPNWGWGGVNAPSQMLIPVPANPNPEPLDYEKLRAMLVILVTEMDEAQKTLREAGVAGDYVIPLDVMKVGLDLDGDGGSAPGESIAAILGGAMGLTNRRQSNPAEPGSLVIGLDRADAIWLAGYTNIVATQADFLLAHDFHELFYATFHRLFPGAGLPLENDIRGRRARGQGYELLDPDSEVTVADLIALIHTIDWAVVEPDRLKRVRERLLTISALSRQNWAAITAETDNDRELLPNPDQTAAVGRARVNAEQIAAWQSTLDTFDQVVNGELLIPHWRFAKGFDVKAYFETATNTDLVMLLTGYDALPFLKDGPIATEASFSDLLRAFGGNWPGYAFWFN